MAQPHLSQSYLTTDDIDRNDTLRNGPDGIQPPGGLYTTEKPLIESDIEYASVPGDGSQKGAEQPGAGVFGDGTDEDEKHLVNMDWWHAGLVMIAETISLGILSLPSVLAEIGLIPGLILIIGLSIISTYTGYVLGQFKDRYPQVHSMADAGGIIAGRFGRELAGVGQVLFLIFVMASHVLTFSIMFNVLTDHAICTIAFMIIGAIVSLLFTLPRTLKRMAYFSLASFISVIAAVTVTMVGVGIRNKPTGPVEMTRNASFVPAFSGVTNICFAYAGHLTFFGFISEMKKPKDYPKALALLQISDTLLYIISAVVIYCYTGYGVASPALNSASPLLGKVAYGIASPTIVISGVINAHVAAKYIYVRYYRATNGTKDDLLGKSTRNKMFWYGLITVLWGIAWLIAEGIPVFNSLLGLISALFVSWFTFGLNGLFWFHMNKGNWFKDAKHIFLAICNACVIVIGVVVMVLGLYTSSVAISQKAAHQAFSCANNAV